MAMHMSKMAKYIHVRLFFSFSSFSLVARLLRRPYIHVGEIRQTMSYVQRLFLVFWAHVHTMDQYTSKYLFFFFCSLCRNVRLLLYLYRMQLACLPRLLCISMECDVRGGYSLNLSRQWRLSYFFTVAIWLFSIPPSLFHSHSRSFILSLTHSIHCGMRRGL